MFGVIKPQKRTWRCCPPSMLWAWKRICWEVSMHTASSSVSTKIRHMMRFRTQIQVETVETVLSSKIWIFRRANITVLPFQVKWSDLLKLRLYASARSTHNFQVLSAHLLSSNVQFCRSWRVEMSLSNLRVEQDALGSKGQWALNGFGSKLSFTTRSESRLMCEASSI